MISTFLLFLLTVLFILPQFKRFRKTTSTEKPLPLPRPPGPTRLPLIGNLHMLRDMPHRAFHKLSLQHGPLMFLQLGSIPTLVVSSSDMAREIFLNHDVAFSGRPVLHAAKRLTFNCSALAFAPYGDYWRGIRKMMTLKLLSTRRVQGFQAVRHEEIELFLDSIARESSVNLSELTLLLTNNIVCRIAFGKRRHEGEDEADDAGKFHEMMRETQELLGGFCVADLFPWLGWVNKLNGVDRRIEKNLRELDEFYERVIREHKESHRHSHRAEAEHEEDLVDVLIQIQNDSNQAISVGDDQIKGVLTDIFLAGTDTSSATLVWAMAELIRNPESMKKAQQELRNIPNQNDIVEEIDLASLTYLKSVLKETLRLHPPAPLLVPRETTETREIKGFEIPAKTRVFVNAKSIGTDPNVWENPNEFRPERFLENSMDYRGQQFEMLPFGGGRRVCPGEKFGMSIVELALANLLRRFDWKLPDGVKREELDMEEAFGITMHKKSPLLLIAHESRLTCSS